MKEQQGFSYPTDIPPTQSEIQWVAIVQASGDLEDAPAPELPIRATLPKPYLRLIK